MLGCLLSVFYMVSSFTNIRVPSFRFFLDYVSVLWAASWSSVTPFRSSFAQQYAGCAAVRENDGVLERLAYFGVFVGPCV